MQKLLTLINEHYLLLVLAIGAAGSFFWIEMHRDRLGLGHAGSLLLAIVHTAYGVFCVRFFAFLESGGGTLQAMSLYGAVFFMPVLYIALSLLLKVSMRDVFDLLTPCTVFTLMCSRFNCLHEGCCQGLYIPGLSIRWPTREIEILYYALFLLQICPMIRNKKTKGEVYPLYVMTYSVLRFVIEWARVYDGENIMHPAHVWSLIALLISVTIYFELHRNSTEKKKGVKR